MCLEKHFQIFINYKINSWNKKGRNPFRLLKWIKSLSVGCFCHSILFKAAIKSPNRKIYHSCINSHLYSKALPTHYVENSTDNWTFPVTLKYQDLGFLRSQKWSKKTSFWWQCGFPFTRLSGDLYLKCL